MADQRNRPVPKRRAINFGTRGDEDFSTLDLYGNGHDVQKTSRIPPGRLYYIVVRGRT